tara:strand:+ start:51 stop:419 length:369 start_codon:yes stop_codon:yes gene_type:complete
MLINGRWYNPASGLFVLSNEIKITVIKDIKSKNIKSFLSSFLFIKKYKMHGINIKIRFNFSFKLKKKFKNNPMKDNKINPKIKFSKKFTFIDLIKRLLNNLPADSKLNEQKKLTKNIFIKTI